MVDFQIHAAFQPSGDQQAAIDLLTNNLLAKIPQQTLLGITGSGKTFTMANVIQKLQRPTLIITHNKTLTAQLYQEFCDFFPENAVEYFVSYYDYYRPEAYLPQTDVYLEKETSLNEELEKLRLSATRSLLERRDVIIVASVSCIYGLGAPETYGKMRLTIEVGETVERQTLLQKLVEIQYTRNDTDFHRGTFRVRGDVVEVFPAYDDHALRFTMFGDEIEVIERIDGLTGHVLKKLPVATIFPASHYVTEPETLEETIMMIRTELAERLLELQQAGKNLEAERLQQRTALDIEMLEITGTCPGIENYSRIITRRQPGAPPPTLIDYFPDDFLIFVDESHVTLPQIRAMYKGDAARKGNLVDFGFRLPCARDNRPLTFDEFTARIHQIIYVSATPAEYEIQQSNHHLVQQIIRPTGLLDPLIHICPVQGQVDDMYARIQERIQQNERILITTLTKRMAEDLTEYYEELGVKIRYMHSEICTLEREDILRDLRLGKFDVLVGINLLREGLDLPEVSLVGIFDADKEGFLRSERSLLQTIGRASRNVHGEVILYADQITASMRKAIDVTEERRHLQQKYNQQHQITPQTILKRIQKRMVAEEVETAESVSESDALYETRPVNLEKHLKTLHQAMLKAAKTLNFEEAARLRDRIAYLKKQ